MENRIPFFGARGFVPAPNPSGFDWSLTTILLGLFALITGVYAIYHFFLKPLKSNDLELENKKVDPLKVMEYQNYEVR